MTSFTCFTNKDRKGEFIDSVLEDMPFRLPESHELSTEGFQLVEAEEEYDKDKYALLMFTIADKLPDSNYVKYLAKKEGIILRSDYKAFYNHYVEENVTELKPKLKCVPIIQSYKNDLLLIGATGKKAETAVGYWPQALEFLPGGVDLLNMYITPPEGYEYNGSIELVDYGTNGKLIVRNTTWTDIDKYIKGTQYYVNRVSFITDYGNTFYTSTLGEVSSLRVKKDSGISFNHQLEEVVRTLKDYCIEKEEKSSKSKTVSESMFL
jgi:hypothetical protein